MYIVYAIFSLFGNPRGDQREDAVGSARSCGHEPSCGHTLIVWNRSVTLWLSLYSHIGSSAHTNVESHGEIFLAIILPTKKKRRKEVKKKEETISDNKLPMPTNLVKVLN
jgi:hypothetical protein